MNIVSVEKMALVLMLAGICFQKMIKLETVIFLLFINLFNIYSADRMHQAL